MVKEGVVADVDGEEIAIRADTICIHGDGPNAAELAKTLRRGLEAVGIEAAAPGRSLPRRALRA
jgi:UPF0271 protein